MNTLLRKRPSPSMIVAMIALFVALSGGAYAGVALNQVRSANIKNGEVKTADLANRAVATAKIANNAVNSAKVANGGLEVADLSAAAQTALRGASGPAGAAGAAGPTGPAGPAGATGPAGPGAMWAVVNANGTLARGSAGVTSAYAGASFYAVGFPQNVTGCVYTATIAGTSTSYPGTGQISAYSANLVPNGVTVVTHDTAGAFADRPFHVTVIC